MPFEIDNISITAWTLKRPTYSQLLPHLPTIQQFFGPDVGIRLPSVVAALTALQNPDQETDLSFRIGEKALALARKTINQCLDEFVLFLRKRDKDKYQAMLASADEKGNALFTDALKNKPELFAKEQCTYYYQGAYMSGDQFAVGTALMYDSKTQMILLYTTTEISAAKRLVKFYGTSCKLTPDRLLLVEVSDSRGACDVCREVVDARISRTAYPSISNPKLQFLTSISVRGAKICPVGGATTDVAASVLEGNGKGGIAKWDNVDPSNNRYWAYRVDKFLNQKGVEKGQRYVIVWTRFSGKDGGAHRELDDSWTGLGQVCYGLLKKNLRVIVVGRPRSNTDLIVKLNSHLDQRDQTSGAVPRRLLQIWGEYWKLDATNPNQKIIGPNRAAEYGIFLRMIGAERNCPVVHLGMRSGAMDAAALLGMRTRFIENFDNKQIERTTKWTGPDNKNPLYQRIPVNELSTRTARRMHSDSRAAPKTDFRKGYLDEDLNLILDSVTSALT